MTTYPAGRLPRPLNDIMELDHVVRVNADGSLDDHPEPHVHAPESVVQADADEQVSANDERAWTESVRHQGWEPETGWTGQYGYAGPFMHASEFIGGALADHILATPGLWVAVAVECLPAPACTECGAEAWADTESGTSHHYSETDIDNIDHDADADHVALVDEDAETEPAGWAVLWRELPMFAYVTTQGTAIAGTAVCGSHRDQSVQPTRDDPAYPPGDQWDGGELRDCTGNDALSCQVCGYGDPDYQPG